MFRVSRRLAFATAAAAVVASAWLPAADANVPSRGSLPVAEARVGLTSAVEERRRLPRLGWELAEYWARDWLRDFFGNKWKFGYRRSVTKVRRLNRIRVRFKYSFNRQYRGFVTVWRFRDKYSFYRYIFQTACGYDYC